MMGNELMYLMVSSFVVIGLCDIALLLAEYLGEKGD